MAKKKVLLMGKAHSGKTSMRSIIFANYLARDTTRLSPTLDVEHHHVRFLGDLVLNLWDCGGQDAFYESYFERDRETIFRSVELLIYVFDIESDCPEKDFDHFCGVLEAIEENSPDARIFILIHKMDLVAQEDRHAILEDRKRLIEESCNSCGVENFQCFGTSIWDETLYKAWSEIVTNLIPNIRLLESHLNNFCKVCDADEVVLFERATFLVISHAQATDQFYNDQQQLTNTASGTGATSTSSPPSPPPAGAAAASSQQDGTTTNASTTNGNNNLISSTPSSVHTGAGSMDNINNNNIQTDTTTGEGTGEAPSEIHVTSLASSPRTAHTEDGSAALASSVDAQGGLVVTGGDLIVDNDVTTNTNNNNPATTTTTDNTSSSDNNNNNNTAGGGEQAAVTSSSQQQQQLVSKQQHPSATIPRHISRTPHFDAHRFEKISNIVKQFKLSCGKAQSQFQGMQVRNSRFSAFIDAFTANTYIMVIVSNPRVHTAATLLNIQNARNHFERFIPRI